MHYFVSAMLIVAGVIHLLPLSGVLGASHLQRLYGVAIDDPNLAILLQHRAVLFGLLGALLVYAAFRKDLQIVALTAGIVSASAFALIAWKVGAFSAAMNQAMLRVVTADWVAIGCLITALGVKMWSESSVAGN